MNFDNKNAIKRVTPCKFLCQIIFCNVEFAQNCRKFEFSGEKIEFRHFRAKRVSLKTHKKKPELKSRYWGLLNQPVVTGCWGVRRPEELLVVCAQEPSQPAQGPGFFHGLPHGAGTRLLACLNLPSRHDPRPRFGQWGDKQHLKYVVTWSP